MPVVAEIATRKLRIQTHILILEDMDAEQRQSEPRFAICLSNRGYEASLEVGKLYRIVEDEQAAAHGYVCVIDESGEDYAYLAGRFFCLEVPQ